MNNCVVFSSFIDYTFYSWFLGSSFKDDYTAVLIDLSIFNMTKNICRCF